MARHSLLSFRGSRQPGLDWVNCYRKAMPAISAFHLMAMVAWTSQQTPCNYKMNLDVFLYLSGLCARDQREQVVFLLPG